VIYGINFATRTFDSKQPKEEIIRKEEPTPKEQKKTKEPEKPIKIEVMPGEPVPEGFTDYRPYLQRDGLILLAWETSGDLIKIVWLCSNGNMNKYQTITDDKNKLSTICPDKRYAYNRWGLQYKEQPDFIIYAAPPDLTVNTRDAFIAKLKASGVSTNFDYEFSLSKQKAAKETAVFEKIEKRIIIPFIGVSLNETGGFQDAVNVFLKEMAYVD